MKSINKKISSSVLLASIMTLQTTFVAAKTPVSKAQAQTKCDINKQQKMKATKDKKSGNIIYHCIYTGKVALKPDAKQTYVKQTNMAKKRASMSGGSARTIRTTRSTRTKGMYLGVSLGQSTLKPRIKTSGGKVTDKNAMATKLLVGYRFNHRFAVEGFYADLGEATVDVVRKKGKVSYKAFGLHGVVNKQMNYRLNGFAKLGLGSMNTNVSNNIKHKKLNSVGLIGAIGLEYKLTRHVSIKGEYDHFDKDAKSLGMGINWSF